VLLARCLESVIGAIDALPVTIKATIVLVSDCSTDRTAEIAYSLIGGRGSVLHTRAGTVGTARALAASYAIEKTTAPLSNFWLANTDADCIVPSAWLRDQIEFAASGIEAVAGIVAVDSFEEHGTNAETSTATTLFRDYPIYEANFVGPPGWYLERPGFWHGACGPASCWAGGAQGLIDYARKHARETNAHAMAHLGALEANGWQLRALLQAAGQEIDNDFENLQAARGRALSLRHLIEQSCTDTMLRFGRAFGPRPLAFDARIARRCHELSLYIRQSHAECDLEELGRKSLTWEKGLVSKICG
jgi:glycosyltransferase involved in cell wall biosynthesis